MTIYEDAKRYNDYIISMRRYFHENPELSGKEINTMKVIGEELSKIGIDYVEVENGGILAKITGRSRVERCFSVQTVTHCRYRKRRLIYPAREPV